MYFDPDIDLFIFFSSKDKEQKVTQCPPVQSLLATLCRPFTKHPSQAAASLVFALCGEEELLAGPEPPLYINNCFPTRPSAAAASQEVAGALWDNSVQALQRILGHDWMTSA